MILNESPSISDDHRKNLRLELDQHKQPLLKSKKILIFSNFRQAKAETLFDDNMFLLLQNKIIYWPKKTKKILIVIFSCH